MQSSPDCLIPSFRLFSRGLRGLGFKPVTPNDAKSSDWKRSGTDASFARALYSYFQQRQLATNLRSNMSLSKLDNERTKFASAANLIREGEIELMWAF